MRRLKIPSTIWHVFACFVIALMLGYIVYEKNGDKHKLLDLTLQQNLDESSLKIQSSNEMLAMQIKTAADCYITQWSIGYTKRLDTLQYLKDSLIHFLDLAKISGDNQDLNFIKKKYDFFIKKTKLYVDYHEQSIKALDELAFNRSLGLKWLALWSQFPEDRNLIISLVQNNIHKNLNVSLNYFALKFSFDGGYIRFKPFVSFAHLNFAVSDENYLEGDVSLSEADGCGYVKINNYKLFLDGKEHPVNLYGGTTFRKVYEQAGTYPIQVRTELYDGISDSVFVSEKTYYIRVQ